MAGNDRFYALIVVMILLIAALWSTVMAANRYSVASSNWNSTGTWSATSGGSSGASVPVSGDVVTIEGNKTVTLDVNMAATITSLTISSGSTFSTTSTYTVAATTITVNGTYTNGSSGTITVTTMTVNNGGTYNHAINGGTIPTATWNAGSSCNLTGITSTMATIPASTAFANLTFNSTQTGALSTGTNSFSVTGTLYDTKTSVSMSQGSTPFSVNNFVNNGGYWLLGGNTTARIMNASGDLTVSSGTLQLVGTSASATANQTVNVTGNVTVNGGTLDLSGSTNATPSSGILNVNGNVSFTSGTITESGNGTANAINFTGSTTQTFTSGATLSNLVNFAIANGAIVDFGTSVISSGSGGTFTVASGGGIVTANTAGITTTGSATGSIQVTGTRTYTTGANYTYNGTADQATGNGLSQNTPANITINNPSHTVTLSGNTNMSGVLTVKAGSTLALSTNTLGATTAPTSVVLENGATASTISGSGALTLGGNVTVNYTSGSGSGATISCPVALSATRTFTVADEATSAADLTVSGIISNAYGVTKAGAGTMVLQGTNSYSGATSVNTGTLLVSGSTAAGSAVTVSSGAILGGTGTVNGTVAADGAINPGTTTTGTLTIGNSLTFSGTGSLFDSLKGTTVGSAYDQVVMSAGTLTLANATLTLKLGYAPNASDAYTLIDNRGASAVSGTFSGLSQGATILLTYNSATYSFTISYTGGSGNDVVLTCLGLNDYTWDNSTSSGIQTGSGTWGSDNFWTLSSGNGTSLAAWPGTGFGATFAGADGAYTITISTTQNVDSLTFSNSGYTLSGGTAINFGTKKGIYVASGKSATIATPISGSGGITLTGGGTLVTSAANSYTGTTTINAGTLSIGAGGTSGSVAGNIAVEYGSNLFINRSNDLTYGGTISSGTAGTVTKLGAGTLTLSGSSSYTGGLTVSSGTVLVTGTLSTYAITIAGGATFGGTGSISCSDITANGTISPGTTGTGVLTASNNAITFSSSGSLAVTLNGTTAGSGYDQLSTNSAVSLILGNAALMLTLGYAPAIGDQFTIIDNTGSVAISGTFNGIANGDKISATYNSTTYYFIVSYTGGTGNDVVLTATSQFSNDYTWDNSTSSGIQTSGGTWGSDNFWTLSSGNGTSLTAWQGAGNTVTFGGADGTYTIVISGTQSADSISFNNSGYTLSGGTAVNLGAKKGLYVASGKSATVSTPITGGGITKTGAGTLILNGNNSYSGTTAIAAGTVQLTSTGNIPDAGAVTLADVAGAVLDLNNTVDTVGSVAGGGTTGGNINLGGSSGHLYCGGDNSSTTYAGVISNAGQVTKLGSGTLIFTGANTYSGSTNVNDGTLSIGSGGTTGSVAGNIVLDNGGTINFNRSDNVTYGGSISTAAWGIITKSGTGTLTLTGVNNITGNVSVSAGTLLFTNANSWPSWTISSGATTGGTGTISCNDMTINGAISPGTTGTGIFTIGGNFINFSSSGSLVLELNSTTAGSGYDQLIANISATALALGNATLSLTLGFAPGVGNSFTIIDNPGSSAVSGTFNGIAQGGTTTAVYGSNTYTFTVSYTGGTGNDVVLTCASVVTTPDNYATWSYSTNVALNTTATGANVSANVLQFPVLLRLNPGNFSSFSQTLASGADIRFAKTNGSHLAYQIERWVDNTGDNDTAEIWVKLDTVYGNNATQSFKMYWGKAGAGDSSSASTVFASGNSFLGSWHLAGNLNNATTGSAGTNSSTVDTGSGIIGKARAFNGSSYFHVGDLADRASGTVSCWFRPKATFNSSTATSQGLWGKKETDSYDATLTLRGTDFLLGDGSAGKLQTKIENNNTSAYIAGTTPSFTLDTWYYVSWNWGGGTDSIYVNGTMEGAGSSSQTVAGAANDEIGRSYYDVGNITSGGPLYFNGTIDEFRIESTNRSAHWVKLCFENQKASQTLVQLCSDYTWDNSTSSGIQTGDGTWGSSSYWSLSTSDGTAPGSWPGAGYSAKFAGADGTYAITVSGTQNVDSITFSNGGYTLSGGTLNFGTKKGICVASGKSATISTPITGTGGITKSSPGTLVFDGNNTYTGTTTVSAGALLITGSTAAGSVVTVNSGATLGGDGTVNGTVAADGTISPGTGGYGTLTVGNNVTFSGTGSLNAALGGTTPGSGYDQLVMSTGTLTLANATLSLTLGYAPSVNDAFTIINNAGSNAVSGTFGGYAQGDTVSLTYNSIIYKLTISYTGGTGNDVVLTYTGVSIALGDNYTTWGYSQSIILNTTPTGANVANNVLNFPVLVRLDPSIFPFFAQTQPNGKDIRFAKSNGTHLKYGIERWNDYDNNADSAEIWVKLDTVYGNNKTQSFVMYWGKSDAADSSNSSAVFDTANGFAAAWFLDQATGAAVDQSMNSLNATANGNVSNKTGGMVGNGQRFDGNGDYFDAGYSSKFDMSANDKVTIMAWVKPLGSAVAGTIQGIACKWKWIGTTTYQEYEVGEDQSNGFFFGISSDGTSGTATFLYDGLGTPVTGNWYHVTGQMDGSKMRIFINGTLRDSVAKTAIAPTSSNATFRIGMIDDDNTTYRQYFNGIIDQVTLCKTNRSADWIKLCYENQKSNQAFVLLEDYSTWGYSRNITINTTGITTTNCIGFPLLVRLTNTTFDFNRAQDSGQDIRFAKSNGVRQPYQIERWNKSGTVADIWVKVDTIYGNNASQYITMYWGKSGVMSRSSGANAFDSSTGFRGVWHLNNDPSGGSGAVKDATVHADNGTSTGTMTSGDLVSAVIGLGNDFEGTDDGITVADASSSPLDITTAVTVSAWFKARALTAWQRIAVKSHTSDASPNSMYGIMLDDASHIRAEISVGGAKYAVNGNTALNTSNYFYGVFTYDGSTMKLYLDGTQETNTTSISGTLNTNDQVFSIGRAGYSNNYLNGIIDEVRVSRAAQSADWIKLCYETQKPSSTLLTCDSADAFRPLGIRRYGSLDSIYIGNSRWALRFAANKGGGVKFLAADTASTNQLDANLFSLVYNGQSSDTGTGTLSLLDSSIVFTRVMQQKNLSGQPFYLYYTVLGSGKLFVRVVTVATGALSGGLEFRIANNATSAYRNIQFGSSAAACKGIAHIDSASGKYDLVMAPYDIWTSADQVTSTSKYAGIKSSTWSAPAGKRYAWNFMIDFSHRQLIDSATAYRYIADYRNSDTLGFFAGTPLLEEAWENHQKGMWAFDEGVGNTLADKSGNSHGGTISGTAHWTNGKWNSGADSLGGSDSVTVAHSTDFGGWSAYTVMAWIKPATALSSSVTILKKYSSTNVGYTVTGSTGGKVQFSMCNGGSSINLQSTTALSTGTWYHVAAKAFMLNEQDFCALYINGNLDTLRSVSLDAYFNTNTDALVIGKNFSGVVEDVRFYNENLPDEDIKAISLRGFAADKGLYVVRADNNNTIHCRMHGNPDSRFLPVVQIKNWWATTLPTYVYIDGTGLTSGTDYYASLDDNRNQLTIGFNRVVNGNSSIFIDDNNNDGYLQVGPTKKMYWGIQGASNQYFWVKNTSGSYFGAASANEFYCNWKMNTASIKDGEIWQMRSSVTNPNTIIDTGTGTNLIEGTDGTGGVQASFGNTCINMSAGYPMSTINVQNAFTYAVEESSQVRVRLRVNARQVSNGGETYYDVTRWTLYPTGQFFRSDSLYSFSGNGGIPQDVYVSVFFNDQTNATQYSSTSKLRGSTVYSSGFPDFVTSWLSMRNAVGNVTAPFNADYITAIKDATHCGFYFNQQTSAPANWNSASVQTSIYIDVHHAEMNNLSIDSISNGVQCSRFAGRRALSMITGTLDSTTAGDFSDGIIGGGDGGGDGFNEMEGAYIIGASNNVVNFKLPAHGDTCRYYPAFRITGYTAVNRPQYVFAFSGTDTNALLEGYQFNSYVRQSTHELILQIDSIFCDSVGIYISSDKTLAVKMSSFEARSGNRCDTLLWRTESEQENLGYRIMRRINPLFYDSIMSVYAPNDSSAQPGSDSTGGKQLGKLQSMKAADTGWVVVNKQLVPGAPSGVSFGPRNYRFVDRNLVNDLLYEYRLVAIDYHQKEEAHGPITVMPRHIAPAKFMLSVNYPNPFRYTTRIRFALPVESKVALSIYTLQGRLVRKLLVADKLWTADNHEILWDGKNDGGIDVATGQYIYRMTTGGYVKARVMLVMR